VARFACDARVSRTTIGKTLRSLNALRTTSPDQHELAAGFKQRIFRFGFQRPPRDRSSGSDDTPCVRVGDQAYQSRAQLCVGWRLHHERVDILRQVVRLRPFGATARQPSHLIMSEGWPAPAGSSKNPRPGWLHFHEDPPLVHPVAERPQHGQHGHRLRDGCQRAYSSVAEREHADGVVQPLAQHHVERVDEDRVRA
jgi:hypothetical protein